MSTNYLPLLVGGLGMVAAFVVYRLVAAYPAGEGKVADIAFKIQSGAMAFMRREYLLMWIVAVLVIVAIGLSDLGWDTSLAFFVGALTSSLAGFIGMYTATRANVRTTVAAHNEGAGTALSVAFYGGSVMGLTVAAIAVALPAVVRGPVDFWAFFLFALICFCDAIFCISLWMVNGCVAE